MWPEYETNKITVKDFLDMLTDWNWHTERVLVETILCARNDLIDRACKVRLKHSQEGCLSDENYKERKLIIEEMEKENNENQ